MIFYFNNIDENNGLKVENYLFDKSENGKRYALLRLVDINISLFFNILHEKNLNDINMFKIEFDNGTFDVIKFTRLDCIIIENSNSNTINLILFI